MPAPITTIFFFIRLIIKDTSGVIFNSPLSSLDSTFQLSTSSKEYKTIRVRYSNKGSWAYDIELLGYKYNITDIASKIGSIQLSQVNTWHVKRKKIVQIYNDSFQKIEGIKLPPKEHKNSIHAWHLYIIKIINNEWSIGRNELIVELNNKGIGTSVHYIPIHMHSYYRNKYGYKPSDFINSEKLSESVISLPLYPDLKEVEVSYIVNSIFELWDEYSKK